MPVVELLVATAVIAYRLSTVRGADRVVVLDEGRIAEVGTYDELLERDGLYARLSRMTYEQPPSSGDGNGRCILDRTNQQAYKNTPHLLVSL
jgi:ABC-type multidrug transport system ATPase subunit